MQSKTFSVTHPVSFGKLIQSNGVTPKYLAEELITEDDFAEDR